MPAVEKGTELPSVQQEYDIVKQAREVAAGEVYKSFRDANRSAERCGCLHCKRGKERTGVWFVNVFNPKMLPVDYPIKIDKPKQYGQDGWSHWSR